MAFGRVRGGVVGQLLVAELVTDRGFRGRVRGQPVEQDPDPAVGQPAAGSPQIAEVRVGPGVVEREIPLYLRRKPVERGREVEEVLDFPSDDSSLRFFMNVSTCSRVGSTSIKTS